MDRNEIVNKVFPHALFGYDPIAVDAFLDEVIRELDRRANTIDVLQFRIANELGGSGGKELPQGESVKKLDAPQTASGENNAEPPQEDKAEEPDSQPAENGGAE